MKNLSLIFLLFSVFLLSCGGNETTQSADGETTTEVETAVENLVDTKELEELDTIKANIEQKVDELNDLLKDLDN